MGASALTLCNSMAISARGRPGLRSPAVGGADDRIGHVLEDVAVRRQNLRCVGECLFPGANHRRVDIAQVNCEHRCVPCNQVGGIHRVVQVSSHLARSLILGESMSLPWL
jgi:hypothetical protein